MMRKSKKITAADLFCGAGGSSTGLRLACDALGLRLELLAINHWDTAIETHSTNHPDAAHLCMNVDQVDPCKAVPSGKLDILIASPECKHHSVARGGKPINDQSRASAWLVLRWAEALDIKNILIENVPEFMSWGPIGTNGRPLQSKKGKTFLAFINALESLGYAVKYQVLNAADYGDPTTRKRLFILARKGHRKVIFPEPTHTPAGHSDMFRKTKKWRAAREIIDWNLKGESIFSRKKPLSPNTMRRIYAGLEKFSGGAFVMATGGPTGQMKPRSVEEPLRTVLTDHRLNVFQPYLVSLRGTSKDAIKSSQRSVNEPVPTLTGGNHQYLAEPFVLNIRGGNHGYLRGASVNEPLQAITTEPAMALVEPFVLGQQSQSRARSTKNPLPTIAADGAIALIEPHIQPYIVPVNHGAKDTRTHSVEKPMPTVMAFDSLALAQPYLVSLEHSGANGSQVRSTEDPMPTLTTHPRIGVAEPYLVSYHGGNGSEKRVHSVDAPLPVQDTSNRYGVAEPYLVQFNGTSGPQSVDEPLPTQPTKDRFGLAAPIAFRGEDGQTYLLDIRFRMLTPKELAAAMSFPSDYKFAGNREKVVKQIGNAVAVKTAQALCTALLT